MSSLAHNGRHFIRCCGSIRDIKAFRNSVRWSSDKRIGMLGIPFNKGQVRRQTLVIGKSGEKRQRPSPGKQNLTGTLQGKNLHTSPLYGKNSGLSPREKTL